MIPTLDVSLYILKIIDSFPFCDFVPRIANIKWLQTWFSLSFNAARNAI